MKTLIVGSRDSALAVAQSMTVVRHLQEMLPDTEVRLLTMKTTGDKILDRTLDQVGGKGLFVKELDAALRDGRADITVHSLKDVPMEVAADLPAAPARGLRASPPGSLAGAAMAATADPRGRAVPTAPSTSRRRRR